VAALAKDVEYLAQFVDSLNVPILRENLDELQQTVQLMQADNADEFYDISTRNKKYGRVDAMQGPLLLEKYVTMLHLTLQIFADLLQLGSLALSKLPPRWISLRRSLHGSRKLVEYLVSTEKDSFKGHGEYTNADEIISCPELNFFFQRSNVHPKCLEMNVCKIGILNVDISVSINPNVTVGLYHESLSYMYVCLWTFRLCFRVYRLLLPYRTCKLPFFIHFTYFLSSEFFKHSSKYSF
jgi:hypothetical protein